MICSERVLLKSGIRAEITYHVTGDGPPVVLLHGWAASWYLWQDTMLGLAAAGYRAYAPDHIGSGESDKPWLLYTPGDFARYLDGFLSALDLPRVVLVGHSLGGHIALSYALAHPERVERMVLVAPAYSVFRQMAMTRAELLLALAAIPFLGNLIMALAPYRFVHWFIGQPWGGLYRPERLSRECLDRLAGDFTERSTPLLSNTLVYLTVFALPGLSRLRRDADLWPRLPDVRVPTLVIWGQHDALLRSSSYPSLVERIAGAQRRLIPEAGHSPMVEAPQEFGRILITFLEGSPVN